MILAKICLGDVVCFTGKHDQRNNIEEGHQAEHNITEAPHG